MYTCGQTLFDPVSLEGPGNLEEEDSELGEDLRRLFETHSEAALFKGSRGWRIVSETSEVTEAMAPAGNYYVSAVFENTGDGWRASDFGRCEPEVYPDGRSPARWTLKQEPEPSDTELTIRATELACSSGRELTADNTQADVVYKQDEIAIIISADPLKAGDCIGNVPSPLTVDLEEPVGDRDLLDASTYPPALRS